MQKLSIIRVPAFIAVVVVGLFFLGGTSSASDEALAQGVVDVCKPESDYVKRTHCYEKNIPALMDGSVSMEQAFRIVGLVLKEDMGYRSCHVTAHLITSKEVVKDPSKWKDVVARSPTNICGTGAYHGAFQERFREEAMPDASPEELHAILDGACDPRQNWNPTLLDQSSCMHGMGHLLLYITQADVPKAVQACEELADLPRHDFRRTCIEGVFMQLFQPLEPEDKDLIAEIEDEVRSDPAKFCKTFIGLPQYLCIKESWPAVEGSATEPASMEALCNQISEREEARYCASAMIYPVVERLEYNFDLVLAFCRGVSDFDFRGMCYGRTASKIVWANIKNWEKAVRICTEAPEESQPACWHELSSYTSQGLQKDSPERRGICSSVPDAWKNMCNETRYGP
jgi:hypothetical protein